MRKHVLFVLLVVLSIAQFHALLATLVSICWSDDRYTQVLFVPLISAVLIYLQRSRVFADTKPLPWAAIPYLAALAIPWIEQGHSLTLIVMGLLGTWISAFCLCYGLKPLRAARFPLSFLLLAIPLPAAAMEWCVRALQRGSAELSQLLFLVLRIPIHWHGFEFSLGQYRFEVASECSGIRSCLLLFVTSVLAGHLFLKSTWARACFSLLTIAVAIFKNAVRIVTISYLTAYVDASIFHSWLHKSGGPVFGLVGLAILVPSLMTLYKLESASSHHGRMKPSTQQLAEAGVR